MNEEKLLREFIAALEVLWRVWMAELKADEDGQNADAETCDMIYGADINTYYIKDKLAELKTKLWSLPL